MAGTGPLSIPRKREWSFLIFGVALFGKSAKLSKMEQTTKLFGSKMQPIIAQPLAPIDDRECCAPARSMGAATCRHCEIAPLPNARPAQGAV